MKPILALLLSALAFHVHASDWTAWTRQGKVVPSFVATGDVVDVAIPTKNNWTSCLAFATTDKSPFVGDLTGRTITAQFHLTASAGIVYTPGVGAGPCTIRLYFTTVPGPFDLATSNTYPDRYWFANYSSAAWETLDAVGNKDSTFTASLADPNAWQNAHGCTGTSCLGAFNDAVSHVAVIGFALGGWSAWDVGARASKTATIYVHSFTLQ